MIITPFARSRFSCASRYYKGNDGAGINSRDIILVIADILCASLFSGGFTDTAVKKEKRTFTIVSFLIFGV